VLLEDDPLHFMHERRPAGEALEEDAGEGVEVAPVVDVAQAANLFRAHVGAGAQCHARAGQVLACGIGDRLGDTEIEEDRAAVRNDDVLGLHVAMDDAVLVGVLEGAE
jgi:hypothetical protein